MNCGRTRILLYYIGKWYSWYIGTQYIVTRDSAYTGRGVLYCYVKFYIISVVPILHAIQEHLVSQRSYRRWGHGVVFCRRDEVDPVAINMLYII